MKTFLALTCCFLGVFLSAGTAVAQTGDPYLLLSDYTYTPKDKQVGTISVHGAEQTDDFVLKGEHAGKFKIKGGNRLVIKGKYARAAAIYYDLTIASADGKLSSDFKILRDRFYQNGVVAHRGAWKVANIPENSIASFEEAVKLGCEGSEFDVHLTADSVVILFHDRDINGLAIEETDYDRLAEETLHNGEVAPVLKDFFEAAMQQNTTKMVLEIKPSAVSKERGIALTNKIMKEVREAGAQGWIDYISFGYDICQRVLELDPYANVAYLNGEKAPKELAADRLFGLDYNQKVLRKHPEWIQEAKDQGLTLNVWTVNKPEDMDWFLQHDFDFITTDEPAMLLEKIGQ